MSHVPPNERQALEAGVSQVAGSPVGTIPGSSTNTASSGLPGAGPTTPGSDAAPGVAPLPGDTGQKFSQDTLFGNPKPSHYEEEVFS